MSLTLHDCRAIMKAYEAGKILTIERLTRGYANLNYKLSTSDGNFLLKIYINKTHKGIQHEMRLLEALKIKNFPAAYPVRTRRQEYILQTNFGNSVVFEFLTGTEPDVNPDVAASVASAVARLNSISEWQPFARDYALHFNKCPELIGKFSGAKYQYPDFFHYFEEQTRFLTSAMKVELPVGLIHGDIFPDNTLFEGHQLRGIVDFEFASTTTLLTEIGVAVNGFCFKNNLLNTRLLSAFLKAYNNIRKITDLEKELLAYYIRAGALIILRWHLNHMMENQTSKSIHRARYLTERIKKLGTPGKINRITRFL